MAVIKWRENLEYDIHITASKKVMRFDWSDWLAEINADTIISVDYGLSDSELTLTNPTNTATTCEVEVACDVSAVVGSQYKLTCVVNTTGGQSEPRTIYFNVIDT